MFAKTIRHLAILLVLVITGCSKVLVYPEGARAENMAVIEQHRPRPITSCMNCTSNEFAIVTALNGEKINSAKHDEIHLIPGHYNIEVTCGNSSMVGAGTKGMYENTFIDFLMKEKGQTGVLRNGDVSTYSIDLKPGSKHWVTMWDPLMGRMKNIPSPSKGESCLFFTK
jgi:hypothetical protein